MEPTPSRHVVYCRTRCPAVLGGVRTREGTWLCRTAWVQRSTLLFAREHDTPRRGTLWYDAPRRNSDQTLSRKQPPLLRETIAPYELWYDAPRRNWKTRRSALYHLVELNRSVVERTLSVGGARPTPLRRCRKGGGMSGYYTGAVGPTPPTEMQQRREGLWPGFACLRRSRLSGDLVGVGLQNPGAFRPEFAQERMFILAKLTSDGKTTWLTRRQGFCLQGFEAIFWGIG